MKMKTIRFKIFLGLIGIFALGLSQMHAQNLPNIKKVTDPVKNAGKKVTNPIKDVRSTTQEITQPVRDVKQATRDVTQPVRDTKREVEGLKSDVKRVDQDINNVKNDINQAKDQVTPNKKNKKDKDDEDEDAKAAAKAANDSLMAADKARADSVHKSKLRKNVYVAEQPAAKEGTGTSTGSSRTVLLPPDKGNVRRTRPVVDNSSRGVVQPALSASAQPGYMRSPARKSIDKVEFDMETLKDLFEAAIWTGPDSAHTARSINFMLTELRSDINEVRQRDPEWDVALYEDRYRKWRGLYKANTRPLEEF